MTSFARLIMVFIAALVCAAPVRAAAAESGVVIMYHRFGEGQHPSTNITLEQFDAHLAELKKDKYTVMKLSDMAAAIRDGQPLPERAVAITIDDAYKSIFTEAWPRLKKAGFPFTVFVTTEPVDNGYDDFLSWADIRKMSKSGLMEIGHHMVTHTSLVAMTPEEIRAEFAQASQRIQKETGVTPTLFSYPYGEYSLAVRDMVEQAGFKAAFGQHSGPAWGRDDIMALPRYSLNQSGGDMGRFRLIVNSLPMPVSDMLPDERLLDSTSNPPSFGFTVDADTSGLGGLKCYVANGGDPEILRLGGNRIEVRLSRKFNKGRGRINCTLRDSSGRWRWLGTQFVVK